MSNNPWNDPNFPFLDFSEYKLYSKIHNQTLVPNTTSEILFTGSCDISGLRKEKYWHEIYCEQKKLNWDEFVKIGTIGQPMPALIRKIYGYLKSVEVAPKIIFMVAPVSLPEYILNGRAYPLPKTFDVIEFLERLEIIPHEVMNKMVHLMSAHRQSTGPGQILYDFCQNFSFLEMITRAYNIEFYWTPNMTRKAKQYYRDLSKFLEAHEFAKKTFLGYEESLIDSNSKDLDFPSAASHQHIANLFLSINKI